MHELEIALPNDVVLRCPSTTGNYLWEIEVQGTTGGSSHPVRFGYRDVGDALVDYMFRFRQGQGVSTNRCEPDPYRSVYSRMFLPRMQLEYEVKFHRTLLATVEAIQEGEDFCRRNEEYFLMQGSGIHRWDATTRGYAAQYEGVNVSDLLNQLRSGLLNTGESFDVFISHASEDKGDCVRPLAEELRLLGLKVWYDEFELKPGSSLRRSVDRGIATSRCGIIVLSSSFIAKAWPQYELDGLIARMIEGKAALIPVWFRVGKEEVLDFSPSLADRVAVRYDPEELTEVAIKIARSLNP